MRALRRLATALRTVSAAALVVLGGGAVVRAIGAAFDPYRAYPGHTSDYGVARTRALRTALPDIAERPDKTVIVLGSSGLARAFVPAAFDAALERGGERYVSFNMAQLLLQPETALAMARVIRSTYEARHKRLGITIFGISVPELERAAVRAARDKMSDQAFAFTSAAALSERARTRPREAVMDALTFLVFGDVRPERVGLWVEDWARGQPSPCESGVKQPPDGAEAQAELDAFCAELRRQFPRGVSPWNPAARGGLDFGLPATRPMLEHLVALQSAAISAPLPPPAGPIPERDDIDEDAVRTLIAAVRELRAVSEHVVVLRDLMNPVLVAPLPPARFAQWRGVAERIAREGGAPLIDPNDGAFGPADFGDRTHLHPLAAERFSSRLADRMKPLLEGSEGSRASR
ncbi:MAG: SGNH/GDSL hydrolase family protein [Minicystis sp.]